MTCSVLLPPSFSIFAERKKILKTFKNVVCKICKEDYGHIVILKALTCVDDTRLLTQVGVGLFRLFSLVGPLSPPLIPVRLFWKSAMSLYWNWSMINLQDWCIWRFLLGNIHVIFHKVRLLYWTGSIWSLIQVAQVIWFRQGCLCYGLKILTSVKQERWWNSSPGTATCSWHPFVRSIPKQPFQTAAVAPCQRRFTGTSKESRR